MEMVAMQTEKKEKFWKDVPRAGEAKWAVGLICLAVQLLVLRLLGKKELIFQLFANGRVGTIDSSVTQLILHWFGEGIMYLFLNCSIKGYM